MMVTNIFVDNTVSRRYILKSLNKYFNGSYKKKVTIIAPTSANYTISVFEKRIRITISDEDLIEKQKTIKRFQQFISESFYKHTICVESTNYNEFTKDIKNVTIIKYIG